MYNIQSLKIKRNLLGWTLAVPTLIGIGLFIVYPIIYSTYLSFTNIKYVVGPNLKFVGWENYQVVFSYFGRFFWKSLLISLLFAVVSTFIQTFLGFILAYAIYNMSKGMQKVLKILVYMPSILPAAVISVMWTFVFVPENGLLDTILRALGATEFPNWIGEPKTAFLSIIFVNTWRFLGITVLIYLINMNAVDKNVVESAKLDGAGNGRILWYFILPLTFSATKINTILSLVGGIKSFDLFYLLVKNVKEIQVVGVTIFKTAYDESNLAWATTMSVILTVILGSATFVINKLMSRGEHD